jgi:pimeloyl-ACP methyl ester carboxylesterase
MSREFTRLQEACRQALTGGDRGLVHDFISCTVFSESYLKAHAAQLAERRKVMSFLPDYWFRGLEQLVECLKGLDLSPILPKVQCPVLVVAAGDDIVMPLARSEALCEKLSRAQLNVIPGCGHALVVERPDLMVRLTRQFCLLGS